MKPIMPDDKSRTTLTDEQALGGILGGEGYAFQAAYIVSRIPVWLADPDFVQFLPEGAGDVDVHFDRPDGEERWYIQVKNHVITPRKAREVFVEFHRVDTGSPGTYTRFVLACPGLNRDLKRLRRVVERLRGANSFFRRGRDLILDDTLADLEALVQRLNLGVDASFLAGKVDFETELVGPADDASLRRLFAGGLIDLGMWPDVTPEGAGRACEKLTLLCQRQLGKTCSREQVEVLIREAAGRTASPTDEGHTPPGGTLSSNSKVYIRRGIDDVFEKALQPGNIIIVRGNVEMGKSSLLASGLAYAEESGWKTIRIDFQGVGGVTDLDDADDLLRNIATSICLNMDKGSRLNPEVVMKIWGALDTQNKLLEFVKDHVLTRFDGPVVLAMDEVNRILNTPLGNGFRGLLKTWQNDIATDDKIRNKLTIVIVFSTEPYLLADDITPLQWTIGTKIEVRDFNQQEMEHLNHRYGSPLSKKELQDMAQLLGGHPYLTHTALHKIVEGEELSSWQELDELAIDDERSPFNDHLIRRYVLIRKRPELEAALRQIVRDHTCPDQEIFLRLQAAGLVRRKGQEYHCRYELYERYFCSRL